MKLDKRYDNPFRYCGEYYDKETEELYLRARYYQPGLGRFLTRDTYTGENDAPGSLHSYAYCRNDGVNAWDPSRHNEIVVSGGIIKRVKEIIIMNLLSQRCKRLMNQKQKVRKIYIGILRIINRTKISTKFRVKYLGKSIFGMGKAYRYSLVSKKYLSRIQVNRETVKTVCAVRKQTGKNNRQRGKNPQHGEDILIFKKYISSIKKAGKGKEAIHHPKGNGHCHPNAKEN